MSGNPGGRPKKDRLLTDLLERAGAKTIEVNGRRIAGRRWLARALWELVTTGKTELPGSPPRTIEAGIIGWFDIVKFLYAQVDGPPRQDMDVILRRRALEELTDEELAEIAARGRTGGGGEGTPEAAGG